MQNLGNFPILASLFAGILTFISPCILPLIPAYITLITGLSIKELENKNKLFKILTYSLTFVLGFSTIFVLLGLSITFLSNFIFNNKTIFQVVGAIIVIIFGIHLTGIFRIKFLYKQFSLIDKINKKINYISVYLMGATFAISWTPCVDPILASILLLASNQETIYRGTLLLIIYSLGLGIPFILTAIFINKFLTIFNYLKKYYKLIEIFSGILLIVIGILILSNNLMILQISK